MSEVGWADLGGDRVQADVDTARHVPVGAELPASADVVVVGMGASGLAAAWHAAKRGVEVVVLDAVGIAAGAAGRNGGFLLAGLAEFHHDAVARRGREFARGWFEATADELAFTQAEFPDLVRPTGSLRIAASQDEVDDIRSQLSAMQSDGLDAHAYDGPEGIGLLVPGDAAIDPAARCHALAAKALAAGARLIAPARVTSIEVDTTSGINVRVRPSYATPEREGFGAVASVIAAGRVVVAVDGGLEWLLPELADRVRTSRLQMLATAPDSHVTLARPIYRRWGYDYVQQVPSGEVFIGGGRDLHADVEWEAEAQPSMSVQRHLDALAVDLGVTAAVTHRWAAHAAFTEDQLPVAEEVRPGVFVVGAYSGHGNLLGPMLAREAVDAALDGHAFRPFVN